MVKASKDVMISFNGVDMKLSITSASTSYSGTYKVVVSNEYGQDESSARLVVKVRKEIRKWSNVRLSLYIYIYINVTTSLYRVFRYKSLFRFVHPLFVHYKMIFLPVLNS